jgi:hypothetical protein
VGTERRDVDLRVRDVNELVQMGFSGPFPLVIEDVADEGERIVVRGGYSAGGCDLSSVRGVDGSGARLPLADRYAGLSSMSTAGGASPRLLPSMPTRQHDA